MPFREKREWCDARSPPLPSAAVVVVEALAPVFIHADIFALFTGDEFFMWLHRLHILRTAVTFALSDDGEDGGAPLSLNCRVNIEVTPVDTCSPDDVAPADAKDVTLLHLAFTSTLSLRSSCSCCCCCRVCDATVPLLQSENATGCDDDDWSWVTSSSGTDWSGGDDIDTNDKDVDDVRRKQRDRMGDFEWCRLMREEWLALGDEVDSL